MSPRLFTVPVLAALLLVPRGASAADEEGPLAFAPQLVTGGYAAPELKLSTLAGDGVLLAGAQAGWILGRVVTLGGGGYTTITNVNAPRSLQSVNGDARLGLGYGGFRMGMIFADQRRIHATAGILVGGGNAWTDSPSLTFRRVDGILVLEPDVEAELNVTKHVRVALGGGYRFLGNLQEPGFLPQRFGGPGGMVSVRLGEL